MEKTATELIDDLRNGSIKSIIIGNHSPKMLLIRSSMHDFLDAVIKGKRCMVSFDEAWKLIDMAKGAGFAVTVD